MASPTITFNTSTGSDGNSGSGGTAITGSSATTSGASTTIALDGSPDLSGVATDGSAVIRITNHGFYAITATDNSAKTVTVGTNINIATGRAWGIGGKLATLDATESRRLFAATSAGVGSDSGAGGGTGGWTVVLEDNQTVSSTPITMNFTGGNGFLRIQSDGSTLRRVTQSTNSAAIFQVSATLRVLFSTLNFRHSAATPGPAILAVNINPLIRCERCVAGAEDGTDCPTLFATNTSGAGPFLVLVDCSAIRCTAGGINGNHRSVAMTGSCIARCGGAGLSLSDSPKLTMNKSVVAHNSGVGILCSGSTSLEMTLDEVVIDNNSSHGLQLGSSNYANILDVCNTQFTNNGGYGRNLSGTGPHTFRERNNNYYNNTSGAVNGDTMDASCLTADPGYADPSSSVRNYAVGSAMRAAGFPSGQIGAGVSGTSWYVDIGPQRQEPAGGGGAGQRVIGG